MRIGVWNLEYAPTSKREAIKAHLIERNANIWILTETRTDILEDSNTLLHSQHSSVPPVERKSAPEDRWASIWSGYPTEAVIIPGKASHKVTDSELMDMRRRVCAKVRSAEFGDLIVYALVMPWPKERNSRWNGALEFFSAEWSAIARLYPDTPLLIGGDFNTAFVGEAGMVRSGAPHLMSKLEKAHVRCVNVARPAGALAMIDHIALPERLASRTLQTYFWPKDYLSDHSGALVEIGA